MQGYVLMLNGAPMGITGSPDEGKAFWQDYLEGSYADEGAAPALEWRHYLSRGAQFATGHWKAETPFDDVVEVWAVSTSDAIRLMWEKDMYKDHMAVARELMVDGEPVDIVFPASYKVTGSQG